jgi:peptide/nickel transport system substrate-binding protein
MLSQANVRFCAVACFCLSIHAAMAQTEKPQYGGTLSVGSYFVGLSPMSWDTADWVYKTAEDAGMYFDRLLTADLSKTARHGGKHRFRSDGFLPEDAMTGDLAESWRWLEAPLRLEFKLRKGVMFPSKTGVMAARELVAEDVVYSFQRMNASPKRIANFFSAVDRVEAPDRSTVVFFFNRFQEDWAYRFAWGQWDSVIPKELADAGMGDWKKATGSGPFQLTDFISGNSQTYVRNSLYWGKERLGGVDFKIPFVDRVITRTIKDESARYTALRTGKLDMLQRISWTAADELKKSAPQLKWARWLAHSGRFLTLRTDTKPFDDVRVRRALNMAVNKQEIVASFYGGHAEVFALPQHPDYLGYFDPLEAMPASIRELYVYNPAKAKQLLEEAGYPKGFSFKAQVCTCNPDMMEMAPLVAAYLERIGVKVELEPLEQGAFFSLRRSGKNAAGVFTNSTTGNPTQVLRMNFTKDGYQNTAIWNDPVFEKRLEAAYLERDEAKRQMVIKELSRDLLDKAAFLWLPTPYEFAAWWPWVKNYEGEVFAGGFNTSAIYSRIWIDQDLKRKMGF